MFQTRAVTRLRVTATVSKTTTNNDDDNDSSKIKKQQQTMMKTTMTCQKSRLRKKSTNENGNRKLRSCFFLNGKCDQFYHEKNDHHHQVQLSYNNTKIILHRKNILAKTRYDCFIKNQTLFLPTASDSCKLKRKLFLAEKKLIIMFCHKKLPSTNRKKCFFKK